MISWLHLAFCRLAAWACLVLFSAAGCLPGEIGTPPAYPASIPTAEASPVPTLTGVPAPSLAVLIPSPSPAQEEKPLAEVCSPLEGVLLTELEGRISNPFNPPPPGSDDPHQGIDLADIGVGGMAQEGLQVNSVLHGFIAAVIQQRFPYGNALMVETRLESLPPGWLTRLPPSAWEGLPPVNTHLTCPARSLKTDWEEGHQSLYLLYAHLQSPPAFELGDEVACGQMLGSIGSSGNALNPHLHLELRLGPAGARFASLAHYDPSASIDEMAAYCTWRVSGAFRLLDPLSLFSIP